jgi:hypothetical protein
MSTVRALRVQSDLADVSGRRFSFTEQMSFQKYVSSERKRSRSAYYWTVHVDSVTFSERIRDEKIDTSVE